MFHIINIIIFLCGLKFSSEALCLLCESKPNKTQLWETSLNQIKDEFNYKFNTTVKVHDIYEQKIGDMAKQFLEFREEMKSKLDSRNDRYFKPINEGNWIRYKNEKNFLLIKKLVKQKNAEEVCKALEESTDTTVTLATIESKDEQNFINKYLYEELAIIENVWIGVTRDELKNEFIINDGNYVKFTNWANGSPSYLSTKSCVHLRSPFGLIEDNFELNLNGFWEDVSCDYNNWVLCQRTQGWSLSRIQRIVYDMNQKFNYINRKLNETMIKLDNMIPIGFIYSQLPSQPQPQTIWPNFNWTDISSQYSGLFFRVLGNNSMSFGETQEDNSPRLTSVRSKGCGTDYTHEKNILSNDQWSENVWSGGNYGSAANWFAMNFKVSSGEVRPRNQAIRIWKRVN